LKQNGLSVVFSINWFLTFDSFKNRYCGIFNPWYTLSEAGHFYIANSGHKLANLAPLFICMLEGA
jgi:hypothetical protein